MTTFQAVTSNTTPTPVLYINAQAPLADLYEFADTGVRAVRDMVKSLASMSIRSGDDADLARFATVAYLLLEPCCNAFEIIDQRTHAGEAIR
ncbi:hypothetical protein [Pseudomonas abieticivorans]|uniref:hypothetical protein n=1 Tax=Pseudomonas abieticivorans TaxID=2931382 RepID=UPI0020C0A641|nr:hypothetical protein [Pseudomonas sp. PIA16]